MRRTSLTGWIALGGLALVGCASGGSAKGIVTRTEPTLNRSANAVDDDGGARVALDNKPAPASSPPAEKPAFVDRHPLFSKPVDVYNSAGNNKVVKVAGATLVGVPVGIAGELKQIVMGKPSSDRN